MTDDPYDHFLREYDDAADSGAPPAEATPADGQWRNIWVWIGRAHDEIFPAGLELLGKAAELASQLGARACAVVFGKGLDNVEDVLAAYGADLVYVADDARFAHFDIDVVREALVGLVADRRPEAFLFPATIQGRNLAAQVASALSTGIVPNCNALDVDTQSRTILHTQPSHDGRLVSRVTTPEQRPQIATVSPGSFRRPLADATRKATRVDVTATVPVAAARVRILGKSPLVVAPLERRDAVLAGGMGLGSAEAFQRLRRLGELLDAAVVATPGAVACGWSAPETLLVRQTIKIRPRIYVGFGVVGDYDHLKAIEGSDTIMAITDDAEAPINEMADLVVVANPAAVLDEVTRHVEAAQAARVTFGVT